MIKIVNKADCCGCSACSNICSHEAITLMADEEGFKYPKVDDIQCVNCGLCEKVCPILNRDKTERIPSYKEIYGCRLKDTEILRYSSSGGAFVAIAQSILNKGGVVVGATYSSAMEVTHIIIENPDEISRLQGSKYVQSNLNDIFSRVKDFLKDGRLVLFSGTPCQVDGLKNFLIKEYSNLYTVDIVCHAVASPKVFKDYVEYTNKKHSDNLIWINMRDKEKRGWGHLYSQKLLFENKGNVIDSPKILGWNYIFFSQYINRPSCYTCRYANLDRPGDFTISDLWDDNNTLPAFKSTTGTSMMMLNSNKAIDFFKEIEGVIDYIPISIETAIQPNLQHPTSVNEERSVFWDFYLKKGFARSYNHFFKKKMTLKRFIKKGIQYLSRYIKK